MNQKLLSVGSKRQQTGGSLRGNTSSSQADEEQMNHVVEEEQQQQQQQLRHQEAEHTVRNGEVVEAEPRPGHQNYSQQGQLEGNNNWFILVDEYSSGNQEEQEEEEENAGEQYEEDEEEEEMDQETDDLYQSDDSSREDEHIHSNSVTNSNSIVDLPIHQLSSRFYTKTTKMKRKLDHGSEICRFSLGKQPCKVSEYTSTTGLVPCSGTPTTFGDLRAANGQGQQLHGITSLQPPLGLQEWLKMFQSWNGPDKFLALDELIDSGEHHM